MLIGGGRQLRELPQPAPQHRDDQYDQSSNTQYFVARPVPRLTPAVREGRRRLREDAISTSASAPVPYDDDMFSVRVRLMYLY